MRGTQRFMKNQADYAYEGLQWQLMRNLTIGEMRSLSPLPEDAQKIVDQAVVRVGLDRLVVVADLLAEGLRYPLTDPLSVMEVQWDVMSETGGAQRTMNPEARGENQLPARTSYRVPVYLTTDDFFMGIRTLRASERVGAPLDTALVEQATRRVNEAIEDAAINGVPFTVGGSGAAGLMNAPNVNTYTFAGNVAWDNAAKTGDQILADVIGMIAAASTKRRFGPFNLYVNTLYGNALQKNYVTGYPGTIQQRLEMIQAGGRPIRIRVADQMPANKVALVQMTADVIDVIDGQAPTTVPWVSPSGFTLYWLVMAIMIPRVKTDSAATSGIVIGTT